MEIEGLASEIFFEWVNPITEDGMAVQTVILLLTQLFKKSFFSKSCLTFLAFCGLTRLNHVINIFECVKFPASFRRKGKKLSARNDK